MQVTVNMPDKLAANVRSLGLTPQSYVEELLAQQVSGAEVSVSESSLHAFNAALDELAQYSGRIPSLPDSSFSRESLYQDHD